LGKGEVGVKSGVQVPVVVIKPGLVNQVGLDEGGEFLNPHIAWVGKHYRILFFIVAAIAVQVVELDVGHAAILAGT
jgi:hypothetical protein